MAVSVTCHECLATHRVKDSLRGKRIRCPDCQAALVVDDCLEELVSTDEEDVIDHPPTESRRRKKASRADLNFLQKALIFATFNPWVTIVAGYVGLWIPLSLISPRLVLGLNVMGILLCALGCLTGMLLAFAGVAMKNPFEALSVMTIGAITALVVPPELVGTVARRTGKVIHKLGGRMGDADTGIGGTIAVYCGVILVVLLAHVVGLSFLIVSRLE